jgi:outer membrane protein OmpA-like peptidoglycan-associated protein
MEWPVLPTREETEMRSRILVSLLFSAVALPAFAQQANSTSSQQSAAPADHTTPASQSAAAPEREPLRETRGDFWDGDEPGAGALIFHPFASKGYVKRKMAPIRDRINELEELSAAHSNTIKDVDARTQGGIQLASTKVKDADQHAAEASAKSQLAQQSASAVNTHISRVEPVVENIHQYKAGTEAVIRFRPGQSVLSEDAKRALDEMAVQLKDQHGYVVEVHGFTPGRGQAAIAASQKMADSVVRYLVLNHEIPRYRIYALGMGNGPMSGKEQTAGKRSSGSRVEVSVLKNSVDQLASTSSSGANQSPK